MALFANFLIVCSVFPTYVFASNFDGDLSYEEGAKPYIQTDEDRLLIEQKLNSKDLLIPNYDPDGIIKTLAVPVYQQENVYYCGPATMKQVVQYIKGSSQSQSYYASQMGTTSDGTDMTVLADKIKINTGKNYVYYSFSGLSDWLEKVIWGIDNNMPSVLDINTTSVSAFPYRTTGHYVNTSGYNYKTGQQVRITDPYGPGLGNIWYDDSDVYAANNAHFRHAIIW